MSRTFTELGGGLHERTRRLLVTGALTAQTVCVLAVVATVAFEAPFTVELAIAVAAAAAVLASCLALALLWRADQQRRSHAESVIALAGSMLIAIDADGRIRMANPAACRVIARTEADLLGEPIHERVISGADSEASREALRRIVRGEIDPSSHVSVRTVVRPDGAERQVAWQVAPRYGRGGELRGLLVSGEDVTERLRAEAAAASELADLEQLRLLAQHVAAADDARGPIVERLKTMVGADFAALAQTDGDGFVYTAATMEAITGYEVRPGEASGCFVVAQTEAPFVVDDAAEHPRVNSTLGRLTASTAMRYEPVTDDGRLVAVLVVGWTTTQPRVDARRSQLLAIAADETALALTRMATLGHLERMALTDALTGVPNRRAFDAELGRAIARATRDGSPLSLAVLDLNEFKALNDRLGHAAGDALLAGCAGSWEAQLRGGDVLARLGGDEFAAVLNNCDAVDAAIVADRLTRATPHQPGSSIGVATWQGQTAHELYQLADRALYRDKDRRRRERVTDADRLAALHATEAWDGAAPAAVDRLAAEARELLDMPGIYVNLVGADEMRHLVKPDADPVRRRDTSDSFCQHVVADGRPFVVTESREEPRVQGSSLIEAMRAYAGMPLVDDDGNVLGALCAIDERPREWEPAELRVLDKLALRIARELSAEVPATR